MRILYVTDMWDGLKDVAVDGELEPRGMPSFINALRGLLEAGHQVDLIVAAKTVQRLDIGPDWLKPCEFELVPWNIAGALNRTKSFVRVFRATRRRIRSGRYDFVYAQGAIGAIGNLAAWLRRVPCGGRLYGSWLGPVCAAIEELGPFARRARTARLALAHPLEAALLRLPKSFLIATNDGTRSDVVQRVLGRDRYEFHHVLNGRPISPPSFDGDPLPVALADSSLPFILFPARIMAYKQPHLAVDLLEELTALLGGDGVDVILAGPIEDEGYAESILDRARRKGLIDRLHLLGAVSPARLRALRTHARCLCVASFNEVSNLGNVALETLADGAVLLSQRDTSVELMARDRHSALLVDDMAEGARALKGLLDDPSIADSIRAAAAREAAAKILPWPERIDWEVSIVEQAVHAS